jgi:hypothetical protein
MIDGRLSADLGYVAGRAPRDRDYKRALDLELSAVEIFLGGLKAASTEQETP